MYIDGLFYLVLSAPLIIIGINLIWSLILVILKDDFFITYDESFKPKVSVIISAYNEGEHVYKTLQSIVASNYPKELLEVICIDDTSKDDTYAWIQKADTDFDNVHGYKNEVNRGKHKTIIKGFDYTDGDILIFTDSDARFEENTIRELVRSYGDEKVGAVGGSIAISNVNENLATKAQALIYFMAFNVGKIYQNYFKKVYVLSGCLFSVRREVFSSIKDKAEQQNFMGIPIKDGEDIYMTQLIIQNGWHTLVNPKAICWTEAPADLNILFKQQYRWRRSGLRESVTSLFNLRSEVKQFGLFYLLTTFFLEFFTIYWAFLLLFSVFIYLTIPIFLIVSNCVITLLSAIAYNIMMRRKHCDEAVITNIYLLPMISIWFFVDSIVNTILSVFTLDHGAWDTRG